MYRLTFFDEFVKDFFENIEIFSFEDLMSTYFKKIVVFFFRLWVFLEDEKFFRSDYRFYNFRSRGFVERTITTSFGDITFKRRKYQHRKEKYYYYIDDKLGIEKYKRFLEETKINILLKHKDTSIKGLCKMYDITENTVLNWINTFKTPKLEIEILKNDDTKTVYIEIDEDHMKCRKSKNTYMRTLTVHLGVEKIYENKNKLKDKYVFSFPANVVKLDEAYEHVSYYLEARYDMSKKKIIVNCDGGKWIESFSKRLEETYETIKIYDKFHLVKAIRLVTKKDDKLKEKIYNWLETGNVEELKKLLEKFEEDKKTTKTQIKYLKIIINQFDKIEKIYTEKDYIGSRTEALVSHNCSKFLSSRPKAFSKDKIFNRALYLNYLVNFGADKQKAKELYLRNEKTEKITEIIDINYTYDIILTKVENNTNVPILNGSNKPIKEMLNNVAHQKIF